MNRASGQKTIMVIDDSEIVLAVTRATLESAGFRVVTHNRAAGTVALILHEKPDLLLLDVNMPNIGGETIAKLFGKAQPNSDTIVLLHSSLPVETLKARMLSAGAHGYIAKTEDAFELLRQVNRWLKTSAHASQGRLQVSRSVAVSDDERSRPSGARPVAARVPSVRSEPEAAISARPSGTMPIDQPLVLFIDDDMSALSAFRREVQAEPYSFEFALSGAQAMKRIFSSSPPQLVVSDVLMPEPTGADIYRRVVASDASWRERFIFVTGASIVAEVSGFLATFRGTVLHKPLDGEALRRAIRRSLNYGVKTTAV